MALPRPTTPLVLPAYDQNRGSIDFDTSTKSTKQKPSAYKKNDVCGTDAYRVLSQALNINQFDATCQTVNAGSASISLILPYNAVAADIDVMVNELVTDLKAALAALQA